MIKEKILVEYCVDIVTKKVAINAEELYGNKPYKDWGDWMDEKREFNVFKNNGKVSKTDRSRFEVVNAEAERLLAERLKIKSESAEDLKTAIKLAKKINEAFRECNGTYIEWNVLEKGGFDDSKTPGWKTLFIKNSHSDWYDSEGSEHMRTEYWNQVPECVFKEAKKLREIRKKHENDDSFDFIACEYLTQKIRVADHFNF